MFGCYHFDLTMEWLTLSLICFPFPVHLTPLANMDRLYCFISFVACACLPFWYRVRTFQQPTQMCCFGVRWSTIGLLNVIISGVLMTCITSSPSWSIVSFSRFRCVCGFYRVGLLALRPTLLSYLVLGSAIAEFEFRWAKKYCRVFMSSRSLQSIPDCRTSMASCENLNQNVLIYQYWQNISTWYL